MFCPRSLIALAWQLCNHVQYVLRNSVSLCSCKEIVNMNNFLAEYFYMKIDQFTVVVGALYTFYQAPTDIYRWCIGCYMYVLGALLRKDLLQ